MSSKAKDTAQPRAAAVKQEIDWEVVARERMHPLQLLVLDHLAEIEGDASPKQMHKLFEHPLGNVSYHVSVLREDGLIEVTRKEQRRGAYESFYVLSERALVGGRS